MKSLVTFRRNNMKYELAILSNLTLFRVFRTLVLYKHSIFKCFSFFGPPLPFQFYPPSLEGCMCSAKDKKYFFRRSCLHFTYWTDILDYKLASSYFELKILRTEKTWLKRCMYVVLSSEINWTFDNLILNVTEHLQNISIFYKDSLTDV